MSIKKFRTKRARNSDYTTGRAHMLEEDRALLSNFAQQGSSLADAHYIFAPYRGKRCGGYTMGGWGIPSAWALLRRDRP